LKEFSLLIKPASADCNLSCEYCFYLDHAALYPDTRAHRMSDEVLEAMIAGYMATPQSQYAFGWQGGEPTLMGFDFFRRVTDLQQKHGRPGALVSNGLQTNATLITDELARHLARYNFLVGVSLDGPAEVHDAYRRRKGGAPTHAEVLKGIRRLEQHKVEFNILTLVHRENVGRAALVYRYLVDHGWFYHQYIPCVEFGSDGQPLPFAVTGPEWGGFLSALFDEWVRADVHRVSIRLFDAVVSRLVENRSIICHMDRDCCQYFVVEYNGDVYPCDFFVEKDLRLGNVLTGTWEDFSRARTYLDFGAQKSRWDKACSSCPFLELCAGDCLKHRLSPVHDPRSLSWLCEGWRRFYAHALPRFQEIAADLRRRPPLPPPAQVLKAVGRNDPCPCGSGKKYKKCCLNRTAAGAGRGAGAADGR
jgi:uncharacterized protein